LGVRLWLVYELFRGAITAEQLAFSEAQAAEFVRSRKADNLHLQADMGIVMGGTADAKSPIRAVLDWFT
jgi:hypothetical protein